MTGRFFRIWNRRIIFQYKKPWTGLLILFSNQNSNDEKAKQRCHLFLAPLRRGAGAKRLRGLEFISFNFREELKSCFYFFAPAFPGMAICGRIVSNPPDLLRVLPDGAVGGEFSGVGHVHQALLREPLRVGGVIPVGSQLRF